MIQEILIPPDHYLVKTYHNLQPDLIFVSFNQIARPVISPTYFQIPTNSLNLSSSLLPPHLQDDLNRVQVAWRRAQCQPDPQMSDDREGGWAHHWQGWGNHPQHPRGKRSQDSHQRRVVSRESDHSNRYHTRHIQGEYIGACNTDQ